MQNRNATYQAAVAKMAGSALRRLMAEYKRKFVRHLFTKRVLKQELYLIHVAKLNCHNMCTNSVSTNSQCTEWKIRNSHVHFRVCSLGCFEFNQNEWKRRSFRTASNICAFIYNYANNSKAYGFFAVW